MKVKTNLKAGVLVEFYSDAENSARQSNYSSVHQEIN